MIGLFFDDEIGFFLVVYLGLIGEGLERGRLYEEGIVLLCLICC